MLISNAAVNADSLFACCIYLGGICPKSNLVSLGDLHETAKGQDYQSFFRRLTENATRLQESFLLKK